MTEKDANDAFDLECFIREKLIDYLQQQDAALPKARMVLDAGRDVDKE